MQVHMVDHSLDLRRLRDLDYQVIEISYIETRIVFRTPSKILIGTRGKLVVWVGVWGECGVGCGWVWCVVCGGCNV